jgi:hypothetical protein
MSGGIDFSYLASLKCWCAWRVETRGGKPTKVPYCSPTSMAQANNPYTRLTWAEASGVAAALGVEVQGPGGGIGLWLGKIEDGSGLCVGGIDYDTCVGGGGIEDWALAGVDLIGSYAETSPSGTGVKQFVLYKESDADALRGVLGIGTRKTGKKWARKKLKGVPGGDHPPAIEIYLDTRYFAFTGDCAGFPLALRVVDAERLKGFVETVVPLVAGAPVTVDMGPGGGGSEGDPVVDSRDLVLNSGNAVIAAALQWIPQFRRLWTDDRTDLGDGDSSRSMVVFRLAEWLRFFGFVRDYAHELLSTDGSDAVRAWLAEKGDTRGGYEWNRAWDGAGMGQRMAPWSRLEVVPGLSSSDPEPPAVGGGGLPAGPGGGLGGGAGIGSGGGGVGLGANLGVGGGDIPPPVLNDPRILAGTAAGGKPVIQVVNGAEDDIVRAAEWALLVGREAIYMRAWNLVSPSVQDILVGGMGAEGRMLPVAGLHRIKPPGLAIMLSRCAHWVRWDGRSQRLVTIDVPIGVVMGVLGRAGKTVFPEVGGVTSGPGLRLDGSVSADPGHDAALRVHRVPDPGLVMPEGWDGVVVRDNAVASMRLLEELLGGYPFVNDVSRSVGLALLLSAVCRSGVPTCPVFAINATSAGSGKSHLVDLVSVLATGREVAVLSAGETSEETEKRLGGILYAGVPIVSLDNVNRILRSDTLNQAATQQRLRVRLLGSSEMVEIDSRSLIVVNGNGLRLSGDLVRRSLVCGLDAEMDAEIEGPESRSFAFDPIARVKAARGLYVAAAMTVLRAHALAGFPGAQGMPSWGSFDDWSRHVRGALLWLGYADPMISMKEARKTDPDLVNLRDFIVSWAKTLGLEKSYTLQEAVTRAQNGATAVGEAAEKDPDKVVELTSARELFLDTIARLAGDGRGHIDTKRLGNWLRGKDGAIMSGFKISLGKANRNGIKGWVVTRSRAHLRLVPPPTDEPPEQS